MRKIMTINEANNLLQKLVGLPVSLPWKGYGSAIFLELGQLEIEKTSRRIHQRGQVCISIEWDWRVEEASTVVYGSSNDRPDIEKGIAGLKGATIDNIQIQGDVPELIITFSNNQRLMSAIMVTGDPEWRIRLADSNWISVLDGSVYIGDGSPIGTTPEENAIFDHAHITAQRWGVPMIEPNKGDCGNCKWFRSINGEGSLLLYGVCTSSLSPFDGRAVNVSSRCEAYIDD